MKCVIGTIKNSMSETCGIKCEFATIGKPLAGLLGPISPHAILYKDSLGFRSLRNGFFIPDWIPGPTVCHIPDFTSIPDPRVRIPKTRIPDITIKIVASSGIHIILHRVMITLLSLSMTHA